MKKMVKKVIFIKNGMMINVEESTNNIISGNRIIFGILLHVVAKIEKN